MDLYKLALDNFPAFQLYIQQNPLSIDTLTVTNQSLLHLATHYHNHELFTFLLAYGIDFNYQDRGGFTALHTAIFRQNEFAVKRLVLCANLNLKNKQSETPLLLACKLSKNDPTNFYKNAITLLIQNKANVNIVDINGRSPLYYIHDISLFQLLHQKDADINAKDHDYISILMINVQRHALALRHNEKANKEILEYMLAELLLQVNAIDRNKKTALHHAVLLKSKETVRILLSNQVARTVCTSMFDRRQQMPIDIALGHNDKVMIDLLKTAEIYSDEQIALSENKMIII